MKKHDDLICEMCENMNDLIKGLDDTLFQAMATGKKQREKRTLSIEHKKKISEKARERAKKKKAENNSQP